MESYIKKINDKIVNKHSIEEQKKIKKKYLLAGGLTLAIGLAGFVSSFITFIVLFLEFKTDNAMIAWFVAIPFILLIVAGSVVTRIGDMLLRDEKKSLDNQPEQNLEKRLDEQIKEDDIKIN